MAFDRKLCSWIACIVVGIAFVANCGGDGGGPTNTPPPPPPPPTAVTVTTGSAPPPRFIPVGVTVAVGGTVTWRNGSPVPHNVTSTTAAFQASPDLNPNETFQVTFPQAGIFGYTCTLHPGMNGTVTVK